MVAETQFSWNWGTVRHVPDIVFASGDGEVVVAVGHPNYAHMAVMTKPVRAALAEDFD